MFLEFPHVFFKPDLDPVCVLCDFADDFRAEQERNRMLQDDMEATLQDIQNM